MIQDVKENKEKREANDEKKQNNARMKVGMLHTR